MKCLEKKTKDSKIGYKIDNDALKCKWKMNEVLTSKGHV